MTPAPASPVAAPASSASEMGLPRWVVPGLSAVAAVVVVIVLALLMFQAMGQRESARQALTTADTQLAGTRSNLASTQRDLSTRKAEMKYLDVFLTGYGKVIGDASKLESCSGNATCLSDLAQLRQDVQNLQTSRAATPVPPTLSAADTQLKGALDQYLASLK